MTWFKVDDKLWGHPKFAACTPSAKALWLTAGSWSSSYKTDGAVSFPQLALLAPIVGVSGAKVKALAAELVQRQLWTWTTEGVRFHNWTDFNPTRAQQEASAAVKVERKKISRDVDLRATVRLRDDDRCRYCDEPVNFAARTGHLAGRYDHVIPVSKGGKTTLENVVVACNFHNGMKLDRTPDEVTPHPLVLLPAPGDRVAAEPGPGSGLARAKPVSCQSSGRVGSGRARTGQDETGLIEPAQPGTAPLSPLLPVTSNGSHPHEHGGT